MPPTHILYTCFDEVPGPKGAAIHVDAFVRSLGEQFGHVVLATPGRRDRAICNYVPGVRQIVLGCPDYNPLGRARTFRAKLAGILNRQPFDVIHFRSIFEGLPLIDPLLRRNARIVYEANGFPSIEMKYHYRRLLDERELVEKLARQEQLCLDAATRIVVVSDVTRKYIVDHGIADHRIVTVRNGVDLERFSYQPPPPVRYGEPIRIIYVGTLTVWQGLETLIEAVELVNKQRPVQLKVVGPLVKRRCKTLQALAGRLKITDMVELSEPRSQLELCRELHRSHCTVVPLLAVDRNTQQGCCPLKLLESMAAGCPVIASDLPVVRELAEPFNHFLPVRAGDARGLKNVILELAADPKRSLSLAAAARKRVEQEFTWSRAASQLIRLYRSLLNEPVPKTQSTSAPATSSSSCRRFDSSTAGE